VETTKHHVDRETPPAKARRDVLRSAITNQVTDDLARPSFFYFAQLRLYRPRDAPAHPASFLEPPHSFRHPHFHFRAPRHSPLAPFPNFASPASRRPSATSSRVPHRLERPTFVPLPFPASPPRNFECHVISDSPHSPPSYLAFGRHPPRFLGRHVTRGTPLGSTAVSGAPRLFSVPPS